MASGLQKGFAQALGNSALLEKQFQQDVSGDYPLTGPMAQLPPPPVEPQPDPLAPGTLPRGTTIPPGPPITPSTFAGGSKKKKELIISQPVRIYIGGAKNQPERVRILSENENMAAAHFLKWFRQNMVTEDPHTGKMQYWIREMIPFEPKLNKNNKNNKNNYKQNGGNCGPKSEPQFVFAPDAVWYEGSWTPMMKGGKHSFKDEHGKPQTPKDKYSVYRLGNASKN